MLVDLLELKFGERRILSVDSIVARSQRRERLGREENGRTGQ